MRTGPFSRPQVAETLNRFFVPAFAVNEDHRPGGAAPAADKAEYEALFKAFAGTTFSTGTVHAYCLRADGTPLASLHVAEAADSKKLLGMLRTVAAAEKVRAGGPVFEPRPQPAPPPGPPGSAALHLVARGLDGRGSWPGTAEYWVTLAAAEAAAFVPAELAEGRSREVSAAVADKILLHVYPVTENNDPAKNTVRRRRLTATVVKRQGGRVLVRLDGRLGMDHWFYHKPDGNVVETGLLGYLVWDAAAGRLAKFRLVTVDGRYGGGTFGVAVTFGAWQ